MKQVIFAVMLVVVSVVTVNAEELRATYEVAYEEGRKAAITESQDLVHFLGMGPMVVAAEELYESEEIQMLVAEAEIVHRNVKDIEDIVSVDSKQMKGLFDLLEIKRKKGGLPNVIALKKLDESQEFDWGLAVSRDLDAVAVAANFRW